MESKKRSCLDELRKFTQKKVNRRNMNAILKLLHQSSIVEKRVTKFT